jgi:purine catabolism regulator
VRGQQSRGSQAPPHRRRSLYYRLDLIAKLIDVHLEDPKQMMMFSVAMTARRIAGVG